MGHREIKNPIVGLTFVYHYDILTMEVINMSITMNKELLIRMPTSLYQEVSKLCKKRYMSISAFVRELLLEQLEAPLTKEEEGIVAKAEGQYLKGKGVNWRKIKRG
ncbi:MAG: hypothetical protein NTV07_07565 [Candidatus Omnitrophica bacterium]|nr:hypothetical protein [Candidatus Omnitrophota bacterium]